YCNKPKAAAWVRADTAAHAISEPRGARPLCPSARKATIRPSECRLTETVIINPSSSFDLLDDQAGVGLTVPEAPAIALLGLVLEHKNLLVPVVPLHGGHHFGPLHHGGTHLDLTVFGHQENPI